MAASPGPAGTIVFVNRAARKGRSAGRTAAALDALARHAPADAAPVVVDTTSLAELQQRAAEAVGTGAARIVVIGGDGLAHHVAQAVAGSDTILGIVPVGTGNDLAGALGLPHRPDEAARVALGPARPLDLLRSGHGWALSVATTGFSAAVNERAEALRWPRGAARYSVATVAELPRLHAAELLLHLEGPVATGPGAPAPAPAERRVRAALVAVGNTSCFGGGMRICPDADPTDGLLDVTVIEAVGRLDLLRHFGRVFRGTHVRHPAVSVYRARAVSIEPIGPAGAAVRADGEAWGQLPCRIEAVPAALRVAAPPAAGR